MTDGTCGAQTTTDEPCQNPAGDNGRCWIPTHNDSEADNPNGRPTKLDEDTSRSITSAIAEGKSVVSASRMAGVHPATVYAWLEKGEDADDPNDPYTDFHDRFVRARGLGEDAYVDDIIEIAKDEGDLPTLMSMLKQRYPESWGDVDRGEQSGGVIVQVDEADEFEVDGETLEVVDQ